MGQIMARYFVEEYRYQIELNQQFIDEPQVFRLLDRDIQIDPADLEGNFDLIVNTGIGTANKNADIQNTQLIIGTLEKVAASIPGMVTPDKVYNIVKLLLEQMGRKNVDDYINTPEFIRKMEADARIKAMAAQGGEENGNQGTAYQPPPAGVPVFRGGEASPAVPFPPHRIAPV